MNEQYDGMCEIVWPAKSQAIGPLPGPLLSRDMKIFDSESGEQLLAVLGVEIRIGGRSGFTPNSPITAIIHALVNAENRILKRDEPMVYEDPHNNPPVEPKMGEFLYLVTAMWVE